jgi:hypothetical protein
MSRPTKGGKTYDREAFAEYLKALLQERNETPRAASLGAGLDHGALMRYIKHRQRPTRESCIALADHFGVNPNEVLTRSGYEAMHFFDRSLVDPKAYPPEVEDVASLLARLEPVSYRREVCRAVHALLQAMTRTAPAS